MNPVKKTSENGPHDELDALLAARPLRPSAGFADRTLARIASEAEAADPALDNLLASRPARTSGDFANRVMSRVAAARRRRFVLLRIVTPASLAACMALAAFPTFNIGRHSPESEEKRVAAAIANDAELRSLATLPATGTSTASSGDVRSKDLAAFAVLDEALTANNPEYAYGI